MVILAFLVFLQFIKLIPNKKPLYLLFLCLECFPLRLLNDWYCLIIHAWLKCYCLLWPLFKIENPLNLSVPLCLFIFPLFSSWHLSLFKIILFVYLLNYYLFLLLQWKLQEAKMFAYPVSSTMHGTEQVLGNHLRRKEERRGERKEERRRERGRKIEKKQKKFKSKKYNW